VQILHPFSVTMQKTSSNKRFFRVLCDVIIVAGLTTACGQSEDHAVGPVQGAVGSKVSSVSIPTPPALMPYLGRDKINSLYLKINPEQCITGVSGTSIEKFIPNFADAAGFLANEKVRNGCLYTVTLSLGKATASGTGFERIYLTNDAPNLRASVQVKDSSSGKVTANVRVYPTQDGKTILGLPGEPLIAPTDISQNQSGTGLRWKMVLMAADQGNQSAWISVFDNARMKLLQFFQAKGIQSSDIRQLSLKPQFQNQSVIAATTESFSNAISSLNATGANDACLVHMTSHGSRDGFNIGNSRLSPGTLGAALDAGCGNRPTVVLVSACYSGLYVMDSSGLKKDNRIILTAARSDRTSFGCSSEYEYTYWDSCLIDSLPRSTKFKDLASNIQACISAKEAGMTTPSLPQAFIGSAVEQLALPGI